MALHVVVHAWVVASHACPVGQSLATLQPHAPATHAVPDVPFVQSVHAPPGAPHAVGEVPSWHIAPSQHAPSHASPAVHALAHWCALGSQALCAGQSAATLQPHAPPFVVATQVEPMLFPIQGTHAPPVAPHAPSTTPLAHVPLSQQPPLQSALALHAVLHVCVVVLQARPARQSADVMQPHALLTHAVPAPLPEQLTQATPLPPHVAALLPATHVLPVGSQQPPLHAE
jgi:hypothetical protein